MSKVAMSKVVIPKLKRNSIATWLAISNNFTRNVNVNFCSATDRQ